MTGAAVASLAAAVGLGANRHRLVDWEESLWSLAYVPDPVITPVAGNTRVGRVAGEIGGPNPELLGGAYARPFPPLLAITLHALYHEIDCEVQTADYAVRSRRYLPQIRPRLNPVTRLYVRYPFGPADIGLPAQFDVLLARLQARGLEVATFRANICRALAEARATIVDPQTPDIRAVVLAVLVMLQRATDTLRVVAEGKSLPARRGIRRPSPLITHFDMDAEEAQEKAWRDAQPDTPAPQRALVHPDSDDFWRGLIQPIRHVPSLEALSGGDADTPNPSPVSAVFDVWDAKQCPGAMPG